MDRDTFDVIARLYLSERNWGTVAPREFADWAVAQLEKDRDSKSIRMLASEFEAVSYSEIERHFHNSISELDWVYPDDVTAINQYASSTMQRMVDGEISPYEGCRQLYEMCTYLGYPKHLYNWNGLFWAHEDVSDGELDVLILDEARRKLAGEATETIQEGFVFRRESGHSTSIWKRLLDYIRNR